MYFTDAFLDFFKGYFEFKDKDPDYGDNYDFEREEDGGIEMDDKGLYEQSSVIFLNTGKRGLNRKQKFKRAFKQNQLK